MAFLACFPRLDPVIKELKATGGAMAEQSIRAREKALLPVYTQMATQFADMHDTPQRMYAKGVINGIVPWQEARRFFAERLKRRLTEEALVRHVALTDSSISRRKAMELVQGWHSAGYAAMQQLRLEPPSPVATLQNSSFSFWSEDSNKTGSLQEASGDMFNEMMREDKAFLAWAESASGRAQIAMELKAMRSQNANRLVQKMLETPEGKEGLLKGLQHVLKTDTALSMQLRALL
jgi:acetyl-CoA carboxylase/biotin carboxylase 1